MKLLNPLSKDFLLILNQRYDIQLRLSKKSFEKGASYYVPKDEINKIDTFLADILEALEKKKNVWVKWYDRLSGFCDRRFGPNWRDEDPEFWNNLLKY